MGNQGCKKDSGISGCLDVCGGFEGEPCKLLYGHISERACRVDYLIVSKKYRKLGAGRALFCRYVEWCKETGIENCYIWPDGETPKRIYEEGGYRLAEICRAGRAVME